MKPVTATQVKIQALNTANSIWNTVYFAKLMFEEGMLNFKEVDLKGKLESLQSY